MRRSWTFHSSNATQHYPSHASPQQAEFLRGNPRLDRATLQHDGDIFIRACDHIFDDYFGFYQLKVLLKRAA